MVDPLEVLTSPVWVSVEPYLDVLSLIALSKTCRPLRDVVVDRTTGKIKSTEVVVKNSIRRPTDGAVDWTLPEARPHYAPRVVNAVHFPSVRRLVMGFPQNVTVWKGERAVAPDAAPSAFPMLAIQADKLCNLEELTIVAESLIPHEGGGALLSTFKILGDNLAKCLKRSRKLKRLTIVNVCQFEQGFTLFSPALLSAMVPVIEAGLLTLEEVSVFCGDYPSTSDYPTVGQDFFEAVLRLQSLRSLRVNLESFLGPLLSEFVRASRSVLGTLGKMPSAASLENLEMLVRFMAGGDKSPRPPISPLLSLFRDGAPALRGLYLWLPPECWDASGMAALVNVLKKSGSMERAYLNFEGYEDTVGHLPAYLKDFVEGRVSLPTHIQLTQLGYVEEQSGSYEALGKYAGTFNHEDEAPVILGLEGDVPNPEFGKPTRWQFKKSDISRPTA